MEVLKCNIRIGGYTFDFVHGFNVDSSWQSLTSRAVIQLPSKLRFDRNNLKESIKKGDVVRIIAGYEGTQDLIFTGYVSRVKATVPVEIECEDAMWKLKQFQVNDVARNEKLLTFLQRNLVNAIYTIEKDLQTSFSIDCFEVNIPKFVAAKITATQLLDQFKQDYSFSAFIRENRLVVGKQYDPMSYKVHIIKLNYNVAQDDLEFCAKDDVKLKVTGISNLDNGKKYEVEIGDPDGESRTLNFNNIPEKELRALVEKESERLMYDGYRGSLTTFGAPFIKHGDVVELRNDEESDKTGRYWVDGVQYNFGQEGIRQTLQLGARI